MSQLISVRPEGTLRVQTVNKDEEMTRQSFRDECDINVILREYGRSGVIRNLNQAQATYADVSEIGDYATALLTVKAAEAEFMRLPAKVRKVFENSPAKFLDAAHDPAKRGELVAAGLLPEERPEDAIKPAATPSA